MTYRVYFEVFGKKLVTEIDANSEEDAKYKVLGKVVFHKVEARQDVLGMFNNLFGTNIFNP